MRLLGKYSGLLIALTLLVVGVRAYGSEPQPEILVSHQQIEQESFNLDTKLHKISILYENNKAWPRWSYANNIRAHRALVDMVKNPLVEQEWYSLDSNRRFCLPSWKRELQPQPRSEAR